jgi:hypothetical protein|tara:strand:- start:210 stop:512 length:303 start_codon:yes stop_codon:yes gene_type:complete
MNFFFNTCLTVFLIFLISCTTVSEKVDRATLKEENRLSKFLQKSVSELKIEFGHPDLIEDGKNNNRILVYFDSKFKIKCERRFEIDPQNTVVGFSSKNCF